MLTQKAMRFANIGGGQPTARHSMCLVETTGRVIDLAPKTKTFRHDATIFEEGEPTDYIYKVTRGAVRSYKMLGDGRRKIEAFRLPGDLFGIDSADKREFSAEAIDEVTADILRRSVVIKRVAADHQDFREIWIATDQELRRVQQHALLLAKTGQQRIACFLREMSRRLRQTDILELPMPRQDIADYLGLTIETVSRMMTRFEVSGTIKLPTSRRIVLRDLAALERLSK
jgi:CRP/FNR family transcriptional regulator, nitrogen fixation regulation protein